MSERVELRRSVINITARCTLRCKLCVMGIPFYKDPPHYSYETIAKTIDRHFEVVDFVKWFEFSGGEPFIHKDLDRMVKKTMEYSEQFEKLLIITNATLMPSENLLKEMIKFKDKIIVMISHYGELSTKADELIALLDREYIEADVKKYYGEEQHFGGWVDYGDYNKFNRTEEELTEIFKNCAATKMGGLFTTHGGQMHWCVPSARGMKLLGVVPQDKSDYIDLFDDNISVEQQKEKILSIINKKHIAACDHCSGLHGTTDMSKRHKAAEQVL